MVYNGYYKVMSNIPKMGHLPTPALDRQKAECAALLQTQALHDWDDTILKDFGYMGAARSLRLARYATASKVLQLGGHNPNTSNTLK